MNEYQILGILIIVLTWIIAGGIYFSLIPNYFNMTWIEGEVVSIVLTVLGIILIYPTRKEVNRKEEAEEYGNKED